jgi:hypothetical protein
VQTYARFGEPSRSTRTRCRFGSNRRFVATIEWERWLPNDGFFPQMEQIFDMAAGSVAKRRERVDYARALARSRAKRSAISSAERTASAALSIRASAWATLSTVRTPKATGTPVSMPASWSPEAHSAAT